MQNWSWFGFVYDYLQGTLSLLVTLNNAKTSDASIS